LAVHQPRYDAVQAKISEGDDELSWRPAAVA